MHEVWPGHFMQYLTRRAHPDWSLARQMANAYSTREGWAHYAEQMMVEQGLGDGDPKLKIAQIEKALLRDAASSRRSKCIPKERALMMPPKCS